MLIEDSDRMRKFIIDFVKDYASSIIEYKSGEDAVRMYPAERPDVVLMDVELEGMDGLSAAELIKSDCPDAEIIFITNYDDKQYKERAAQLGSSYILKENLYELRKILSSFSH